MSQPTTEKLPTAATTKIVDEFANAQDGTNQEQELGFFEALLLYRKGVFWSFVMSTAIIMEGYDTKVLGTLFAQPAFQKAYGQHVKGDSYQITAAWQAGLSNSSAIGQLLGLLMSGYLVERFGFRKTMITGLTSIIALIFMQFFAPSLAVLEVSQILFGKFISGRLVK
jgi:SP family general alpha glucoside:H+ symporter-like MFS transporter